LPLAEKREDVEERERMAPRQQQEEKEVREREQRANENEKERNKDQREKEVRSQTGGGTDSKEGREETPGLAMGGSMVGIFRYSTIKRVAANFNPGLCVLSF